MRSILALALALVSAAMGCQTSGIGSAELPETPIAFVYYEPELARRRAELLGDEHRRDPRLGQFGREGVFDLNAFRQFLSTKFGAPDFDQEFAGRMALLNPRTGVVEILASAHRGAVPQDWSDDRRYLLFSQDLGDGPQLYQLDVESRVLTQLTSGPDVHPSGCYGADGVVVVARVKRPPRNSRDQATGLVGALVGGAFVELSAGPVDREPTCSPDGSSVAYVLDGERGTGEIWIRSTTPEGLPTHITPGRHPRFSRDGRWIVYTQESARTPVTWRVHPTGAGRTRIGRGAGSEELRPSTSPDGGWVVYESVRDNRFRLFVRRVDGTGDRVLFADGDGTHAVW